MIRRLYSVITAMLCFAVIAATSVTDVHAAGVDDHARNCTSATTIELGGQATTAFTAAGDRAVYKVVLDKRGLLDVWVDPDSMDIWTMALLDSSCRPITAINGGTSVATGDYSQLTIPSTDLFGEEVVSTLGPDTYFVEINADRIDVFGEAFTIHTRFTSHYGHECATAEPMALNSSMKGDLLYDGDREVFRIVTTELGEIHAIATSATELPAIEIFSSDCSNGSELLATNRDDVGIATSMLAPGVYFVSVSPTSSMPAGPYLLTVAFSAADLMIDPESFKGICERLPD
jgi:hypothetical protein